MFHQMNHGKLHNVMHISTTPSHSQAIMNNTMKKGEVELMVRVDISMNLAQWSRHIYRMSFVD